MHIPALARWRVRAVALRPTGGWSCVQPVRYDIASHLQRTHEVLLLPFPARRARVA